VIVVLEAGIAERMDEVVHDLHAVEHTCDRTAVGRIGGLPFDAAGLALLATRDCDDVVFTRELGQERPTDRSRGAEDENLHTCASAINRAK